MELEFKPDFEAAQAGWRAFCSGERSGPLVGAVVAKAGVEPVDPPPYTAGRDGDFAPVIDQLLRWAETHQFLGAAIPFFYLEFAAAHFALLLGAELRVEGVEGNGWVEPFVEEWDDADIRFRPEGQKKTVFLHTLNGSALATSRVMVSVLEHYQDADGGLRLPEILVKKPIQHFNG